MMETLPALGYENHFSIRTYEIDNRKRATVPAMMRLMHEAAMQNVLALNLSVWDLEPHHISWVLMRQHLYIYRYPQLGESVLVQTHPAGFEKFFTYRDYYIRSKEGEVLAKAASTWLLMDTRTRRMARIPAFILDKYADRMPATEHCLPRPEGKLPKLKAVENSAPFIVRWHDLDFNMHLNNTFYPQWMLEALPTELLQEGQLKELDIQFKFEAVQGDIIYSEVLPESEHSYLHQLVRQSDSKELAIARTVW